MFPGLSLINSSIVSPCKKVVVQPRLCVFQWSELLSATQKRDSGRLPSSEHSFGIPLFQAVSGPFINLLLTEELPSQREIRGLSVNLSFMCTNAAYIQYFSAVLLSRAFHSQRGYFRISTTSFSVPGFLRTAVKNSVL